MSQIPAPRPAPAQPTPVQPTPGRPGPATPFMPNPSESAMLWLAVGIATLFVGYLIVDGIIQRWRRKRSERRWKEQARRAARGVMAQAREAGRPLNEREATKLPPPR